MKTKFILLALAAVIAIFTVRIAVADDADGDYIKVEIKGTLQTGIMAIGGETTGTIVRANNVTWELDFGGNKELQDLAATLDKKAVVVTGAYQKKPGVEIKERHIVKVATLKAADGN